MAIEKIRAELEILDLEKMFYWSRIYYKFIVFIAVCLFILAMVSGDHFPSIIFIPLVSPFFFLARYLGRIKEALGNDLIWLKNRLERDPDFNPERTLVCVSNSDIIAVVQTSIITIFCLITLFLLMIFVPFQ